VPADVAPNAIQSVGRYAIQIEWSDGHGSGIYPFARLRTLVPTTAAAGPVETGSGGRR